MSVNSSQSSLILFGLIFWGSSWTIIVNQKEKAQMDFFEHFIGCLSVLCSVCLGQRFSNTKFIVSTNSINKCCALKGTSNGPIVYFPSHVASRSIFSVIIWRLRIYLKQHRILWTLPILQRLFLIHKTGSSKPLKLTSIFVWKPFGTTKQYMPIQASRLL